MSPNRLARESSPYLQQHAHNPVEWYPWGDEALALAREVDRPILLSIGYSACHWCHVMERESFEDDATAALMNKHFVNVKVDREERPDVDAIYMRAVQALTGRGGWPLTVFLTPEGRPYYGGTYFPPEPRQGMPSFRQVLESVRRAWVERREEVTRASGEIVSLLERSQREGAGTGDGDVTSALTEDARRLLASGFDRARGGFGGAPKFPQPVTLEFLLRHHRATGDADALEMVTTTLRAMAAGGIRDHLGGGFHRYTVDARWLVPHFEKMLYDNALLGRLYAQAWQVTGEAGFREAAEDTFDWLLTDMRAPDGGGFYAARDADSEGEEGRFYVWTPDQVEAVLGPEDAALFNRVYDITDEGNFEGRSIPHLPHPLLAAAAGVGLEVAELESKLADARTRLLEARAEREPPLRDEKVLASWNGMAVRALAEAGGASGRDDWVAEAATVLDWLLDQLRPEDELLHVWTAGEAKIPAFLDDYAALGNAALTVHEVTLDPRRLGQARRLAEEVVRRFWEEDEGVFYDTSTQGERLVVRPRETMDNATPSGTSLAAELCLRAGHLFGDDRLSGIGRRVLDGQAASMSRHPSAFGRLLSVAQGTLVEPLELALIGPPDSEATRALLRVLLDRYRPERTVVGSAGGVATDGTPIPLLEARSALTDDAGGVVATAYLCRNYACDFPVTDPAALAELLGD